MITLNRLTLSRGTKLLFSNVNLSFYDKQKIGVVGKNGSGKTSLFSLIQGSLEASDGDVFYPSKLKMVNIDQDIPSSNKTAQDYVIDADILLRSYQEALIVAEKNEDGIKVSETYEALQRIDGFTAEKRATKILTGLGFSQKEITTRVNALSGGWRMRLNIARTLFMPSDVLLLDEPTNHLDLDAVIWLEKWLTSYSGLLLFISHDREFLDNVADHIVNIEHQHIKIYSGNYSTFEKHRAVQLAQQQQQYEKQKKETEHIEAFIRRFKAKASKARQAQSRIKALERMKKIMPAHIDSPFSFEFKPLQPLSNPLLSLNDVSFSYGENEILTRIRFQLRTEDRIALLGKNGAGKSTLIKLLAQQLIPSLGEIMVARHLKIGYFAQHTLDQLNPNYSPLSSLRMLAQDTPESALRAFLGGFAFSKDMALMTIAKLSGGERARLALALIVWQSPHILLLDEPTNHLDLDMRQSLTLALQNYEGAVVLVSHDRFLLKQVVDCYWLVGDKKLQPFEGDLEEYQRYLLSANSSKKFVSKAKKADIRKKSDTLERAINKIEKQITVLDTTMATLSLESAQHKEQLTILAKQRVQLIREREAYEKQWFQLLE